MDVLDLPAERAVMLLWTLALDLTFAAIEHQYSEVLDPLFRGIDDPE
jgi:hypothetical protein